jgi:hypothetical protein
LFGRSSASGAIAAYSEGVSEEVAVVTRRF